MEKKKTKQIYIYQFDHPFEALLGIFSKYETMELICKDEDFKIKKFIGSDWSIKDSGFIFYGPNNLNIVFLLINIEKNDFIRVNKYLVTHINGEKLKEEIKVISSAIRNTTDNTTVIELRLEYNNDDALNNLEKYINFSSIKQISSQIFSKKNLLLNYGTNNNDLIIINHSFIINKNYKEAFSFFYNWNNVAKSIKTDKVWKIISENKGKNDENYKSFYIFINENIKIHYHVISIEEKKGEKIEIVYNKTSDSYPSLNNYIKLSFFNISKDICFFLYETHLPINISSSIYQTVSYYVYYCNKKSKNYIESNLLL